MTTTASEPSKRRFSVAHLILILPWIAIVIDAWAPIRDNSFLWHIRAGALQAADNSVFTVDPFSFTENGETWLTQSWLGELAYSIGEDWFGGLGFVPPMMLVLASVTFLSLGLIAYKRSESVSASAAILLIATLLLISFLVPRPVLFSFALFALTLLAWDIPRLRWTLPFVFWVWASVHGSFAIGLAYVGLSLIAEKEWRRLPTIVVSGLVTLATAHGLGVVQMLLDFASARETLSLLSEWQRPGLTDPVFLPFLLAVIVLVGGFARKRVPLRQLWVVVPFVLLGPDLVACRAAGISRTGARPGLGFARSNCVVRPPGCPQGPQRCF